MNSHTLGSTNVLSQDIVRLWQDIVHWPPSAERLVVASRVESQCSDQLAVVGEKADVEPGEGALIGSLVMFSALHFLPGDPVARKSHQTPPQYEQGMHRLGLDLPLPVQ